MKEEIERFKERRDARIKAKRADEDWITMSGTHVLIDDDGQVSKGPDNLKSVVKSGGGYKSKAERKYGSSEKYSKALRNGWSESNKPSAGKYIDFLEKEGFRYKHGTKAKGRKEEKAPEKTGAEESREKMIDRNRPSAGEYIDFLDKAGFGKNLEKSKPRTRGEIMQATKKMYEKAQSDIKSMKPGIEKDVTEKLILPWIKGNNWMGGLSDRKHQQIVSKMPYSFDDIQKEFEKQTEKYMP